MGERARHTYKMEEPGLRKETATMTTNQLKSEEESRIGLFGAPTRSITPLLLATELAAKYLEKSKDGESTESELSQSLAPAK